MPQPANLYQALGGAPACHALSTAFYARVARDPVLRPFFPSTFRCAIDEFAAFLVQFLGGESEATQLRWQLSLRQSHSHFALGPNERAAWLRAMSQTLGDEAIVPDAAVRQQLLAFFTRASAYIVNQPAAPLTGELAPLWDEQLAIDRVVALIGASGPAGETIELLQSPVLQCRFARSPSMHASILAKAALSKHAALREFAAKEIRLHPSLIEQRYSHSRTLLHDAAASGNVSLVEQLLEMGAGKTAPTDETRSPLYCVANECNAAAAGQIVRLLLRKFPSALNQPYGVKRCTPLHMAARRGNTGIIAALLDAGANLEARDSAGDTPLRRAVNCNKAAAGSLLLSRGADAHSVGSKSLTPASAARTAQMKQLFGS